MRKRYTTEKEEKNKILIGSRRNPFTERLTFTCSQLISFW